MALTTGQQNTTWQKFVDGLAGDACQWNQNDLRTAVNAIDAWIIANQASFVAYLQANAAVFANNSTAAQKTALFCFVAEVRAGLI